MIDLTLSDDESTPTRLTTPHFRVTKDNQMRKSDKIEGDLLSSQTVVAEKKRGTSPVSTTSQSASMQALQGRGEDGEFNDSMNESLKIALRQQVFPHVNQRLGHYRVSIDVATRRQLGKKVSSLSPRVRKDNNGWSDVTNHKLGSLGNLWRGLHEQPDGK